MHVLTISVLDLIRHQKFKTIANLHSIKGLNYKQSSGFFTNIRCNEATNRDALHNIRIKEDKITTKFSINKGTFAIRAPQDLLEVI
jgi:hypothetical protein